MKIIKLPLVAAFLLVLVAAPEVAAQTQYGAKLGLSSATTRTDVEADYGYRTSYAIGGFARMPMGSLTLQPELLYVQKGATTEVANPFTGQTMEMTATLSYLELPVLAAYELPVDAPVSPYLFAGPAPALKLSEGVEVGGQSEEQDDEEIASFDLGLVLGGGADYTVEGVGTLTFDLRYTMGLINVADSDVEGQQDLSAKNGAFSLMVGYLF